MKDRLTIDFSAKDKNFKSERKVTKFITHY